jgi:hypothetical protein
MVLVRQGHDLGKRLRCEIGGVVIELRPQDLSLAGLFVPGSTPLALDHEVEVLLHSPIGELTVAAQVVQVISGERALAEGRSAGSGLLFINLADDQRAFIGLTLDALQRVARAIEPAGKNEPEPKNEPHPKKRQRSKSDPRSRPGQQAKNELQADHGSRAKREWPQRSEVHAKKQPAPRTSSAEPQVMPSSEAAPSTGRTSAPAPVAPPPPIKTEVLPAAPKRKPETPASQQALRELEQALAAVQSKPPWAILGLAENTDLETAKQAFFTLSKSCHPHAFAHFDSPQISKVATALFIARKKALEALQASARAAAPTTGPASSRIPGAGPAKTSAPPRTSLRPPPGGAANPAPMASWQSLKAGPMRSPRHAGSASASSAKVPSKPPASVPSTGGSSLPPIGARRAADAERALASGLKHLAASRFVAATAELERARSLHPGSRDPELWLRVCRAREAKTLGQGEETRQFYQQVLELDPEHREALEHVGGRDRRKWPGLISKLFGGDDE